MPHPYSIVYYLPMTPIFLALTLFLLQSNLKTIEKWRHATRLILSLQNFSNIFQSSK